MFVTLIRIRRGSIERANLHMRIFDAHFLDCLRLGEIFSVMVVEVRSFLEVTASLSPTLDISILSLGVCKTMEGYVAGDF